MEFPLNYDPEQYEQYKKEEAARQKQRLMETFEKVAKRINELERAETNKVYQLQEKKQP